MLHSTSHFANRVCNFFLIDHPYCARCTEYWQRAVDWSSASPDFPVLAEALTLHVSREAGTLMTGGPFGPVRTTTLGPSCLRGSTQNCNPILTIRG